MQEALKIKITEVADIFEEIKYQTKTNEHDAAVLPLAVVKIISD